MTLQGSFVTELLPLLDSRLFSQDWLNSLAQLKAICPIGSDWISVHDRLPEEEQYCEIAVLTLSGWYFRDGFWYWDAEDWCNDRNNWVLGLVAARSQIAPIFWRPAEREVIHPDDY